MEYFSFSDCDLLRKFYPKGLRLWEEWQTEKKKELSPEEEQRRKQVIKRMREVCLKYAPKEKKEIPWEEATQSLRKFRNEDRCPIRIRSKKWDCVFIMVRDEEQRKELEKLQTVEEPLITVNECIWLLKNVKIMGAVQSVVLALKHFEGQLVSGKEDGKKLFLS